MTRALCLVFVIAGCQARAEPQPSPSVVKPAGEKQPATTKTEVASAAPAPSAPPSTAKPDSHTQLIETFVVRDVLTLTPEAAIARFASVIALKRERESIDGFVLTGATSSEKLDFEYSPNGKGGFSCELAKLAFSLESPADAATLRQSIAVQLQAKFGKPKKHKASGETQYWKLGGSAEASLLEYGAQNNAPSHRTVEIRIAAPGGP